MPRPTLPVLRAKKPLPITRGAAVDKGKTRMTPDEQRVVDMVFKLVDLSEKRSDADWNKAVRFNKVYRAWLDNTLPEEEAAVFIPYGFGQVETIIPRVASAIFPNLMPVKSSATHKLDIASGVAQRTDALFSHQFFLPELDNKIEFTKMLKDGGICGKGFGQITHTKIDHRVKVWKDIEEEQKDAQGALTGRRLARRKLALSDYGYYEGPEFEHVEFHHFLRDPYAKSIGKSAVAGRKRVDVRFWDLERLLTFNAEGQLVPLCKNLELAKKSGKWEKHPAILELEKVEGEGNASIYQEMTYDYGRTCDLVEMHFEGRVIWVVNKTIVVLDTEDEMFSPQRDFVDFGWTVDTRNFVPMGMIEPCESLYLMLNDTYNLSMDNWLRLINQIFAVNVNALAHEEDLEYNPTGIIRLAGNYHVQDAIMPVQHRDITGQMVSMQADIKQNINSANGVNDYVRGQEETRRYNETLGGIQIIKAAADARFKGTIELAGLTLAQVARNYHVRNMRYQVGRVCVPVTNSDGSIEHVDIDCSDITPQGGHLSFTAQFDPNYGDEDVAKILTAQTLEAMYKYEQWRVAQNDPRQPVADIAKAMKVLIQRNRFPDPDNYLKPAGGVSPMEEINMILAGKMPNMEPVADHVATLRVLNGFASDPANAQLIGPVLPLWRRVVEAHREAAEQALASVA